MARGKAGKTIATVGVIGLAAYVGYRWYNSGGADSFARWVNSLTPTLRQAWLSLISPSSVRGNNPLTKVQSEVTRKANAQILRLALPTPVFNPGESPYTDVVSDLPLSKPKLTFYQDNTR